MHYLKYSRLLLWRKRIDVYKRQPNGWQNVTAALARMGFRLEDIRTAMSQFLVQQMDKADEFQDIGE